MEVKGRKINFNKTLKVCFISDNLVEISQRLMAPLLCDNCPIRNQWTQLYSSTTFPLSDQDLSCHFKLKLMLITLSIKVTLNQWAYGTVHNHNYSHYLFSSSAWWFYVKWLVFGNSERIYNF